MLLGRLVAGWLTVWVSTATGAAAPAGAPSYTADPLTEHITRR